MHGTGNFPSNTVLAEGGRVCLLESRKYDPVELLDTIEREQVNAVVWVGDPFSPPAARRAGRAARRVGPELARMIISSGAMWSEPVKEALLAHHPGMLLVDAFSSSEALGMGVSVSASGARPRRRRSPSAPTSRCSPRTARPGGARLRRGRRPGARRAQPARLLQGRGEVRPHLQGDRRRALLHPRRLRPGRRRRHHPPAGPGLGLHQLGRREDLPRRGRGGAQDAPAVRDAVVVGVPHPTYGEQIVAVVELDPPPANRRRPS